MVIVTSVEKEIKIEKKCENEVKNDLVRSLVKSDGYENHWVNENQQKIKLWGSNNGNN